MQYDPIKRSLGNVFNQTPLLRKIFYKLLDLLLLRAWHIKKEIRSLKKLLPADARVLDAGSGFGQYSWFMSGVSKKWTIKGVDVKQEQIDDCNQFVAKTSRKDRIGFEYADLVEFEEDDSYDLILSVDVMEHIEQDFDVFANFYDSLKPGGMLVVSTPSDMGGSDVHDHDEEHSFIDEHVRDGYGVEDITEKLIKAGFDSIYTSYTYGAAGRLSWRLSMKYPIKMLNISKIFFVLLPFYYIVTFPISIVLNYMDLFGNHKTGSGLIVKARK